MLNQIVSYESRGIVIRVRGASQDFSEWEINRDTIGGNNGKSLSECSRGVPYRYIWSSRIELVKSKTLKKGGAKVSLFFYAKNLVEQKTIRIFVPAMVPNLNYLIWKIY